jgi:hypothetical protein
MFASKAEPLTLQVPGMPGQTVTIRKLGHSALRDAERVCQVRAVQFIRENGPEALQREVERHGGAGAVFAKVAVDPWLKYDAATLIERSVLSWNPPRTKSVPERSELEAWLAREIACFSDSRLRPTGGDDAA